MKEYKCIGIKRKAEETEKMLNELAKEGWELVCAYSHDSNWLILERKK